MKNDIEYIVKELKSRIVKKYSISDMKLIGSTARGDRGKHSDIDVFVLLPTVDRKIEEDLFDIAYDLELEFDCLIDLIVFDEKTLEDKYAKTPFYQSVLSEGLTV